MSGLDAELMRDTNSEYKQARLQAEANAELLRESLISAIQAKVSMMKADNLADRYGVEKKRLAQMTDLLKPSEPLETTESPGAGTEQAQGFRVRKRDGGAGCAR